MSTVIPHSLPRILHFNQTYFSSSRLSHLWYSLSRILCQVAIEIQLLSLVLDSITSGKLSSPSQRGLKAQTLETNGLASSQHLKFLIIAITSVRLLHLGPCPLLQNGEDNGTHQIGALGG